MRELYEAAEWAQASEERQDEIVDQLLQRLPHFEFAYARNYNSADPIRIVTLRDTRTGAAFNLIPGGRFRMGFSEEEREALRTVAASLTGDDFTAAEMYFTYNPDDPQTKTTPAHEAPVHEVQVPPFLMARFPLLATQFDSVSPDDWRGDGMFTHNNGDEEFDIVEFYYEEQGEEADERLQSLEYRLPSEAEWEYACRAGSTTLFHWGNTIPTGGKEWTDIFRDEDTESPAVNRFGLSSMGAYHEVCADTYYDSYIGAPTDGSAWVEEEDEEEDQIAVRVARGGGIWSYPWQGCGEWSWLLSSARNIQEAGGSPSNIRPVVSLPSISAGE